LAVVNERNPARRDINFDVAVWVLLLRTDTRPWVIDFGADQTRPRQFGSGGEVGRPL
jgi:hypothetical protein